MGSAQANQSSDYIFDNYQLIKEEHQFKIITDKVTQEQFILKEHAFVNKSEYEKRFKKISASDNQNKSENITKLVRLWSKQHNGVCSNLFKIYTIYEHPSVKLSDQIEVRRQSNKYFEEVQLFSILHSCVNALRVQPEYLNISPQFIYITEEGVIKLSHIDLFDSNYQTSFSPKYYYSPEKIEKFTKMKDSANNSHQQIMFSIGMTLLHSALLQSPVACYEISLKRFNKRKLELMKSQVKEYSEYFKKTLYKLLQVNFIQRLTLDELEQNVNQYFEKGPTLVNSFAEQESKQKISQSMSNCLQLDSFIKPERVSLAQCANNSYLNKYSEISQHSDKCSNRKNQFQIVFDSSKRESFFKKSQTAVSNTKKSQKENIHLNLFTDSTIIKMINEGINHIEKVTQQRKLQNSVGSKLLEHVPTPVSSSKDLLSQYELLTRSKEKSMFIMQTYEDKSRYEGMIENNMKNGYGKLIYQDGVCYEGNFKDDCLSGNGTLFFGPNRPAYTGQWNNNRFNGFGMLFNEHPVPLLVSFDYKDFSKIEGMWIKFEGNFIDDVKQGKGKVYLTNGEWIEGEFKGGVLDGESIFFDLFNNKIKGIWKQNKLVTVIN